MSAEREELAALYRQVCGFEPRGQQLEVAQHLLQGRSVVLRAPTGWGKSEAVFLPFLLGRGGALPSRLIYALPARALVNSLAERFQAYATAGGDPDLEVRAHHGAHPDSLLFWAPAVVTTLDQVVGAYACTPLSLPPAHGNIPAGAVASSLLVFDEVHTYDPLRGLQCCLFLAERACDLGVPFVFMTATLPGEVAEAIARRYGAVFVDVLQAHRPRDGERSVRVEYRPDVGIDGELVLRERGRRTLVVCNTVDRARELARALGRLGEPALLIHSRYTDHDRLTKERALQEVLGKEPSDGPCLAVCTQVVEVGLDISAEVLITELAPVDSLIQRAGRCARWGGEGRLIVCGGVSAPPYERDLMSASGQAMAEFTAGASGAGGALLDWKAERALVDQVLSSRYRGMIEPGAAGKAVKLFLEAAWEGNRKKASQAVREADACEVVVADRAGREALRLPRVKVRVGALRRLLERLEIGRPGGPEVVWRLRWEPREDEGEGKGDWKADGVSSPGEVYPGALYVLSPAVASYSADWGLVLGEGGGAHAYGGVAPGPEGDKEERSRKAAPVESWEEHALKVLKAYDELVAPRERYGLQVLARALGGDTGSSAVEEAEALVRAVLLVHDLGKLSQQWQADAWRLIEGGGTAGDARDKGMAPGGGFVAHTGTSDKGRLPPHATVSALALFEGLAQRWGVTHASAIACAVAHHHCCRARAVPRYALASGWRECVNAALERCGAKVAAVDLGRARECAEECCSLPGVVSPAAPGPWAAYVVLSRMLRLADRAGTGGIEALLETEA
ncbi:MAG: CRISPR-associated helicase Cas3' [Acetobacteraceae bacterium]|nr:CRISPR-associated helicase Cas3' [Acetobacteraceae bacterium]